MNYLEAIKNLTSPKNFYIDLSLDRIKTALEKLKAVSLLRHRLWTDTLQVARQ